VNGAQLFGRFGAPFLITALSALHISLLQSTFGLIQMRGQYIKRQVQNRIDALGLSACCSVEG
jgi:hypothetical protein